MTRLVPFRGEQEDITLKFDNDEGGTWVEEWDFERKPEPEATAEECEAIDKWIETNLNDIINDYFNDDGDYRGAD